MNYLIAIVSIIVFLILIYFILGFERWELFSEMYNLPNLKTSIGGRKGDYVGNDSYGLYHDQRVHLAQGWPNVVNYQRTLIDPSQVGFSYNSLVNRNVYEDLYSNIGNRRRNPNFKYVTRFKGLELQPARYSLPSYPFATI